jgi:hypothetical protein
VGVGINGPRQDILSRRIHDFIRRLVEIRADGLDLVTLGIYIGDIAPGRGYDGTSFNNTLIGSLLGKWFKFIIFFQAACPSPGFPRAANPAGISLKVIRSGTGQTKLQSMQLRHLSSISLTAGGFRCIPLQGLAGGIGADNITLAAAHALVQIVLGDALTVQIEMIGGFQIGQGLAHQIGDPVTPRWAMKSDRPSIMSSTIR